jgi:hypothetical protein
MLTVILHQKKINMTFNKSKKAINKLRESRTTLNNISNTQEGNNWKTSLKASFILYLGKESAFLGRLENLFFTRKVETNVKNYLGTATKNVYDDNKKENFRNLIDNVIEHIESHGLYKNATKKNNLLSEFNNTTLISGLFAVAVLIFAAGTLKGKYDADREIIENNIQKTEINNQLKQTLNTNKQLRIENDSLRKKPKNSA